MIEAGVVQQVAALVQTHGMVPQLGTLLTAAFPAIRFTLCSEDDIHAGKPVHAAPGFAIYLVGSGEHCLTLTNDHRLASGVVVAERYEEE